jgi:hypothetical protein
LISNSDLDSAFAAATPIEETNGYIMVNLDGGLSQQMFEVSCLSFSSTWLKVREFEHLSQQMSEITMLG